MEGYGPWMGRVRVWVGFVEEAWFWMGTVCESGSLTVAGRRIPGVAVAPMRVIPSLWLGRGSHGMVGHGMDAAWDGRRFFREPRVTAVPAAHSAWVGRAWRANSGRSRMLPGHRPRRRRRPERGRRPLRRADQPHRLARGGPGCEPFPSPTPAGCARSANRPTASARAVGRPLVGRGQTPLGTRAAWHPRWFAALGVAFRPNSSASRPSKRLASPAPRRSRCSGGFIHGLLVGASRPPTHPTLPVIDELANSPVTRSGAILVFQGDILVFQGAILIFRVRSSSCGVRSSVLLGAILLFRGAILFF